jgi:hypothetical protein
MDVFALIYNVKFAGKYQNTFDFTAPPEEMSLNSAPEEPQNIVISLPVTLPLHTENITTIQPITPPIPLPEKARDILTESPLIINIDEPFNVTLSVVDNQGAPVADYTGTVYFRAKLTTHSQVLIESWRRYTFQREDAGKKLLSALYTFKKAGNYEITLMAQLPTLIEKRILVTVKDTLDVPVPETVVVQPTKPIPTLNPSTPPPPITPPVTPSQILKYRFRDSSTPPDFHRSYTIEVTQNQAKLTIDSYNTILATHIITLEKNTYDAFLKNIVALKLLPHNLNSPTSTCPLSV